MDIQYLVFGGGGAAGYAYSGAIAELESIPNFSLKNIKGVGGTSVGAIVALIVALNYTPQEASEKIAKFDLKSFKDGGSPPSQLIRLLKHYGRYRGNTITQFVTSILRDKIARPDVENITFADLKTLGFKDLQVVATKIYKVNGVATGKEKIFSYEKTPNTSVLTAIRASTAAPYYFSRIRLEKINKGEYRVSSSIGDLFEDGGLINNYPLDLFDYPKYMNMDNQPPGMRIINPHTLGFVLLNKADIYDRYDKPIKTAIKDNQPIEFAKSVLNTLMKHSAYQNLHKEDRDRTIQIDRQHVKLNDFDINEQIKAALVTSGKEAVRKYFAKKFKQRPVSIGRLWERTSAANDTQYTESSISLRIK